MSPTVRAFARVCGRYVMSCVACIVMSMCRSGRVRRGVSGVFRVMMLLRRERRAPQHRAPGECEEPVAKLTMNEHVLQALGR